jgi:hypothetical protein
VASPDSPAASPAPARLSPDFADRVLAGLEGAQHRRSQREARRLGVAMLLIGLALGLVLLAAVPFRGPGVGTHAIVSWFARALVVLNTLGRQEDALLARLHLAALPVGVAVLVLASCLVGVWRLMTYDRKPGRRPRRRTFLALFALTTIALALALLTPLRAWDSGMLRLGPATIARAAGGPTFVVGGSASLPAGLDGGLSVIGGNAVVDGPVQGDVVAVLGDVELAPGARVAGDAIAVGGRVVRSPGSAVAGDVIGSASLLAQPARSEAARVRLAISAWIGLLLLGVTLSALFPWPMLLVAATARRFSWQSLLTAAGAGIGVILVIVPLALSIAGLPIALALLMVTLLAWAFGLVAVGIAVGRRLLRPFGLMHSTLLAAVCGLGVMGAIAAIPILGPVLITGAGLLGAGAAVISALDADSVAPTVLLPRR